MYSDFLFGKSFDILSGTVFGKSLEIVSGLKSAGDYSDLALAVYRSGGEQCDLVGATLKFCNQPLPPSACS